jgi:hypothetical protein
MVTCPGGGVQLQSESQELDDRANASQACRDLYHTLSYYTISLGDFNFIHQLAVDAYGAQHYGPQVKPIGITFALVGLYLVNEGGYTGRQVQRIHMALAKKSKVWPTFTAPKQRAALTVQDVVEVPDEQKQALIKKWHTSVWDIWKSERETIAHLLKTHLDIA